MIEVTCAFLNYVAECFFGSVIRVDGICRISKQAVQQHVAMSSIRARVLTETNSHLKPSRRKNMLLESSGSGSFVVLRRILMQSTCLAVKFCVE